MTLSYEQACATLKRLLEEETEFNMNVGSRESPSTLHIIPLKEGYWVWLDTPDLNVEQDYPRGVKIELTEVKYGAPDGTIIFNRWGLEINKQPGDSEYRLSMTIYVDEGHDLFGPEVCE